MHKPARREENLAEQIRDLAQRQAEMITDSTSLAGSLCELVKRMLGSKGVSENDLFDSVELDEVTLNSSTVTMLAVRTVCDFCCDVIEHAYWNEYFQLCNTCRHDMYLSSISSGTFRPDAFRSASNAKVA